MPATHPVPDILLSSVELGGQTLANRIALAPMTRGRAPGYVAHELMRDYYTARATAGLVITEGTFVSEEAIGWVDAPGVFTPRQAEAWKPIVDAVHNAGGVIYCQLWHTGRASHSAFHGGVLPVAPSPVRLEGDGVHIPGQSDKVDHETPRELTVPQIQQTVRDFANAAGQAKTAGFDGVEVHSANGYLLDTFLQSKTNRRTDDYGGSIANRLRLLGEVLDAVGEHWPANRIGVRLSPNGAFNDMGSDDFRDTFTQAFRTLSNRKLAYLHVLDGLAFGFHEKGEPLKLEEIREDYEGTLIANCGYDRDDADQAIRDGHADLVAIGRPYLGNPDLVEKFKAGEDLKPGPAMKYWYGGGVDGYTNLDVEREDG